MKQITYKKLLITIIALGAGLLPVASNILERISMDEFKSINETAQILQIKLNNFIKSTTKNARNNIS